MLNGSVGGRAGRFPLSWSTTLLLAGANMVGAYCLYRLHHAGRIRRDDDTEGKDNTGAEDKIDETVAVKRGLSTTATNTKTASAVVTATTNETARDAQGIPMQIALDGNENNNKSTGSGTKAGPNGESKQETELARLLSSNTITIVHGSITGTCRRLAERLHRVMLQNSALSQAGVTVQLATVDDFDWWDELLNAENDSNAGATETPPTVVLVLPTNTGGTWPVTGERLRDALQDLRNDWRIERAPLRKTKLRVAVFGMGSSAYDVSTMGQPAKEAFQQLRSLGADAIVGTVGVGDNAVGNHADKAFRKWMHNVVTKVEKAMAKMLEANGTSGSGSSDGCGCSTKKGSDEGCCQSDNNQGNNSAGCCQSSSTNNPNGKAGSGNGKAINQEGGGGGDDDDDEYLLDDQEDTKEPDVIDLEDMGDAMTAEEEAAAAGVPKEMVTPSQAAALKKEGYKLIGTHSAVKLCRWTKHQLRGRGGCYKHTFYGITSYQCMEATPSLACANKCVFCIAEGTLVNTSSGVSILIEDFAKLMSGATPPELVALDESGTQLVSRRMTDFIDSGIKDCVEILFKNGTKLVCTPDHRIRTINGEWVKAVELPNRPDCRVATGAVFPRGGPEDIGQTTNGQNRLAESTDGATLTSQDATVSESNLEPGLIDEEQRSDEPVLPIVGVGVVSIRNVGPKHVFDLSVPLPSDPTEGSFMANGVIVHNCWRHHKNPVGREWRWKTDDPYEIVDEAVQTHVQMIKEAKGIPGVKMDRWKEAHTVRHCALSLVGEPIMYPRIDEFLGELHNRQISTFLVTNGQHPQAINSIRPITQLYVSVDAPTKDSLIAIDRPLFNDAWERLRESLSALKTKGQRTVARLTVVKGWNSDEIDGYAKLIALGHVSLVEIKGVTFCGKSDASNLNMSNTPWHHEVIGLARTLKEHLDKLRREQQEEQQQQQRNGGGEKDGSEKIEWIPEYDLACEHKHSVSVLLARVDQFSETDPTTGDRKWKTWIDYDKFQQLAAKNAADPSFVFTVEDYTAETPSWALMGAQEEGFDPTDTRHRKKKKHPKYTRFDNEGIPTHDHNGDELTVEERSALRKLMEQKKKEVGAGTTVTELRGGEKAIQDASLMFRGLVVSK